MDREPQRVFVAVWIYLAAESQGYCLAAVYNLLIVVASCCGAQPLGRLQCSWQRVALVVRHVGLVAPLMWNLFQTRD